MSTMLEKTKLALRISHSYLDSDITDTINAARAEMIRSGISSDVAEDETNPVVTDAIKTYCKMVYAKDTQTADAFSKSFTYQQDCIRKSSFTVPYEDSEGE